MPETITRTEGKLMGEALRRTPLWDRHHSGGARMVGFAGWEMPLQYPRGQIQEHLKVRSDAGLFDVSHMGRFRVAGAGAVPFVDRLLTNDLGRVPAGQLLYSPICLETGGVIDDVTAYRHDDGCMIVANASNRAAVWDWMQEHRDPQVAIEDLSESIAQVALQGPRSQERLAPLVEGDLDAIGYYRFGRFRAVGGAEALISRNGYTGEDGFEIYLPSGQVGALWDALLERAVEPVGLGARDTLRMEMGYALYGNELDRGTTPLEAGLGWTVKWKKGEFLGRSALWEQKERGLARTLVGFAVERAPFPRHGHPVVESGEVVGRVTSGGPCPSLGNRGMGLGFVPLRLAQPGTTIRIDVRGSTSEAAVVERPFYRNASHR